MSNATGDDGLRQRIDAALHRLPAWQPPAGFTQRLAAAAHRQHIALQAAPFPAQRWGRALERLGNLALLFVTCSLLAAAVAFLVPWQALASQPGALTAACIGAMVVAGAVLAGRSMRLGPG